MMEVKQRKEMDRLWKGEKFMVVMFTASWCGPCQMMKPMMARLEKEHRDIKFVALDIDEEDNMILADQMRVDAVPTVFYINCGVVVKVSNGLVDETDFRENLSVLR